MALWRTRTLTSDQKAQISEEQEDQDDTSIMLEDAGSFPDVEDAKLSKVFTAELPINVSGQYSHLSFIASAYPSQVYKNSLHLPSLAY